VACDDLLIAAVYDDEYGLREVIGLLRLPDMKTGSRRNWRGGR